jgi:hypothetical protein
MENNLMKICPQCGKETFYKNKSCLHKANKKNTICKRCKGYADYVNLDFFEKIDTEEKAYWLGFIYADGNINKETNSLCIVLSIKDYNHLEKLAKIFNKKLYTREFKDERKQCKKETYSSVILKISSKQIKEDLISKSVVPGKTYIDSDEIFNHIPDNLLNHFIRGYFDGDGCVYATVKKINNYISFVGQRKFLNKTQSIIVNYTGASASKNQIGNGCETLKWGGVEQIKSILEWLYKDATVFLERKQIKAEECIKNANLIRKIDNYRGVSQKKNSDLWRARIRNNDKEVSLGSYKDKIKAALAYDSAIIKYNKPLYKLNFKQE